MTNSKLIKLLKLLDKSEINRFMDFIQSPYFNKHLRVKRLAAFLYKFSNNFNNPRLTKREAAKHVFKTSSIREQQLSDLMSYLTKLLEEFFAVEYFKNKPLLNYQFLLSELTGRNALESYQIASKEFERRLKQHQLHDLDFHFQAYLFESVNDAFFIRNEKRRFHESIQKKSDSLDYFYISAKLKVCCEMINRMNIVGADYKLNLLSDVLNYLERNTKVWQQIPSISIYYHIYKTLIDSEKEQHYTDLILLLDKKYHLFSLEEARQMYDFAQNYCIRKINGGNINFNKRLFQLYKKLLRNRLIFDGKSLSQWDYKNIVTIALREEEFEWTKNFIQQFKESIAPEFRENAYAYNMSTYYYAVEKYKEALKLLQTVEFTDVFYHLGSKSLLLKAYYEMDAAESFYSLISTFRVYLRRNKKISQSQFTNHLNLINLAKKCFDLKYNDYSKFIFNRKLATLKNKVIHNKNIANIVWLNEKIEEFEK